MTASRTEGHLILLCWLTIALSGCPGAEQAGPAPDAVEARGAQHAPPAPGPPTFELSAEAVTFTENNPRHQVELEVTVSNPGTAPLAIDWSQLVANGGCLSPLPGWSLSTRPRELQPGQTITARASWSCNPPLDPSQQALTSLAVTYYHLGSAAFRRDVPVRILGTEGVTVGFGPPISARPFVEPVPARGGGWDVCARGVARSTAADPVMFLARIRATIVEPAEPGGVANGWLGERATRLDPGATIDERVCWRFYGQGQPRPGRLRIESMDSSGSPQEIVIPPAP